MRIELVRRLLAAAVFAGAALVATPAGAATYGYDVTVKTTVDFKRHDAWGNAKNGGDRHVEFSTDLYSDMRGVQFTDGVIAPYLDGGQVVADTVGFYSAEDRAERSPTRHLHCDSDPEKPGRWGRSSLQPMGAGDRSIALRVTDKLQYEGNCDDGRSPGYGITSIDGNVDDYDGPFDQIFTLPAEAIGQGKIIQLVDSVPVNSDTCPGYGPQTTLCEFSWQAEVTFVRSDHREPAPSPSPAPGQAPGSVPVGAPGRSPGPVPAPSTASDEALVTHVTDAIREYLDEERIADSIARAFRDSHRSAKVQLDCPGPCSGTVSAYAVATVAAAPSGRPLATATLAAPGGAAGRRLAYVARRAATPLVATLRFDAADRRAMARRRFVALRFAIRTADDPTVRSATVVLRRGGRARR